MNDISIIVPTRNRAGPLHNGLASIAAVVNAPKDRVEIVVIDNGSSDNTAGVCREIKARFGKHNWRYFYDQTPGLLTGRHLGARKAEGEILAFLDDDVQLTPSWLEALQDAFADPEVMLAGGPTLPHFEVEPPPWLAGMWMEFRGGRVLGELSLIDLGPVSKETDPLYIPGANFAIRRGAFQACGGFHPDCLPKPLYRYLGDGEIGLARTIRDRGLKAFYHPGAAVKHVIPASRLTPKSFEQRGFYQGVGDSYFNIRHNGGLTAWRKSLKEHARSMKWKLERNRLLRYPTPENIRFLVARARIAGRWFHELEVSKDPKLFEWVLKPDYFDYRLPAGWERLQNPRDAAHW